MRIQLIVNELAGFHGYTGGIGVAFRALAEQLAAGGDDVTVVTSVAGTSPEAAGDPEDWDSAVQLCAVDLPRTVLRLGPTATASALSAAALRRPADVVMAAEWGGFAAPLSLAPKRPPLVTHLATSLRQVRSIEPASLDTRQALRDREQMRLERLQTQRSDAVVAISRSIRDWSYRLWELDFRKLNIIPNFVPVEALRSSAGVPPWRGPLGPTVVFAGRLSRWKGADVLGAAMPAVWAKHPEAQVHLLGRVDAAMDRHLYELAGSRADQLHVWGHQGRPATLAAFAAADVAVFPSLYEGFGIAALEAMALGCAVVVTGGSGFDEFAVHDENALVVPPGSSEELGAALVRLLGSDELRAKLGAQAASSAERYDVAQIVPRYRELFEAVAR